MKPERFPEAYVTYAEDQPEYQQLPAWKEPGDRQGRVITCWRLSWLERLRLLFTGRVWHQCLTFNQPLQPVILDSKCPFLRKSRWRSFWDRLTEKTSRGGRGRPTITPPSPPPTV